MKNNENSLSPLLKWAGGKRWLVPVISEYWEKSGCKRLVEPFCGGLSISLGILPTNGLQNDINPHVINFYKWIQKGFQLRIELHNSAEYFYQVRDEFNNLIESNKAQSELAAQYFYYLNKTCFNGLCRFNQSGKFNVSFGKYKSIIYQKEFPIYKEWFRNWEFSTRDFEELMTYEDDFIYADPPYDVDFRQYSKNGFSWNDQVRLANWLSEQKGTMLISNQATDRIIDLYSQKGFEIIYLEGPRRISCSGDRSPALEILATKNIEKFVNKL